MDDVKTLYEKEHVCDMPRFPGTKPGALAGFILWQLRHAIEYHESEDLSESELRMVEDICTAFEIDLGEDATRAAVIRLYAGGMGVAASNAETQDEAEGILAHAIQLVGTVAAKVEMGDLNWKEVGQG